MNWRSCRMRLTARCAASAAVRDVGKLQRWQRQETCIFLIGYAQTLKYFCFPRPYSAIADRML